MSGADSRFQTGLTLKEQRRLQEALVAFESAVEIDPDHAAAWAEIGWVRYGLEHPLEEASEALQSAIDLDPMVGMPHVTFGIVLNRLGQRESAEAHFRLALGLVDHPDLSMAHAIYGQEFLWQHGRYGEAEAHFRAGLEAHPECQLTMRYFAEMLTCHGRDAEAMELYRRALAIRSDNKWVNSDYDQFLHDLVDECREPLVLLELAVEADPGYTRAAELLERLRGK